MRVLWWSFAVALWVGYVGPTSAAPFQSGHGDIGIWWVPSEGYQLRLSNGDGWQSEPGASTIVVNPRTRESVPAALATPGSGLVAGGPLWKLPQSATEAAVEGAPWLGVQIHGGSFTGTSSSAASGAMQLELVSASGPGQFVMWQDIEPNRFGSGGPGGPGFESRPDLLAAPAVAFNSALATGNHVGCWSHMHTHMNWGFTAPGAYDVTLRVSGTDPEAGVFSDTETFRFVVQDEVHEWPAAGDLNGDGTIGRGDVAALARSWGALSGAMRSASDLNGDGRVGLRDAARLQLSLGALVNLPTTLPGSTWTSGTGAYGGSYGELPPTVFTASTWDASRLDLQPGETVAQTLVYSPTAEVGHASPAGVPEPGTLALAGIGCAVGLCLSRRRGRLSGTSGSAP